MLLSRRFSSALACSPFLARVPPPPRAAPATPPAPTPPPYFRVAPLLPAPAAASPSGADKDQLFRGLEAALGTTFSSDSLAPPPEPMILVISGPSYVGKDAVIKRLQEKREGIHFVVTAISRAKRPGEIDGKDYYFVTKEEFLTMIEIGLPLGREYLGSSMKLLLTSI